jgi:serine/threonine-protein kinase RsbW
LGSSKQKRSYSITIASHPDQIQKIEALAEQYAKELSFSQDEMDSLAIAVTEVVANAIYHANKQDPNKSVTVRFEVSDTTLTIRVIDEGEGFELDNIQNPLDPENLMKESGRGIFIVRTLMDDVQFHFHSNGTEVVLVKHHKSQ